MANAKRVRVAAPTSPAYTLTIPASEYRNMPIPGMKTKIGDCFVKVLDLPDELGEFMEVNPRVPNRTAKDVLLGPVITGIRQTLTDSPEDMAIKNQGIYLLVEEAFFEKKPGGEGQLRLTLTDSNRHGIVNGGHTFAVIKDTTNKANDATLDSLSKAYVRLHILQDLPEEKVSEIAEGLNRSKQVDDPSLANLKGHFDKIRAIMKGRPGADQISYFQGDNGPIYISELLVMLEMFNCDRFNADDHPWYLSDRRKSGLEFYQTDLKKNPSPIDTLVNKLPDILILSDLIRKYTPEAAKEEIAYGRVKFGKHRAGSEKHKKTHLNFLDEDMNHFVPDGWIWPMLAAFRANVDWIRDEQEFKWKVPIRDLVPLVIHDLVKVCVSEYRLNPEKVGKRQSTYVQCYDKIQLHLLKSGKD